MKDTRACFRLKRNAVAAFSKIDFAEMDRSYLWSYSCVPDRFFIGRKRRVG
jgi:hypothetical protein